MEDVIRLDEQMALEEEGEGEEGTDGDNMDEAYEREKITLNRFKMALKYEQKQVCNLNIIKKQLAN